MTQFARPAGPDIDSSGWTPTPIFSNLNETAANDTTFVQCTGAADFEVPLLPITDPVSSTGHTIRIRGAGRGKILTLELRQNSLAAPVIATFVTTNLTGPFATQSYTLSGTEADKITDYAGLSLKVTSSGACQVSWSPGLEAPDFVGDVTPPATPTGLAAATGQNQHSVLTHAANGEGDLAGYNYYQSEDGGANTVKIGSNPTGVTTFDVTGLTNGTTYTFYATAFDTAVPPNESAKTTGVAATPAGYTYSGTVNITSTQTYTSGLITFDPAGCTLNFKNGSSLVLRGTAKAYARFTDPTKTLTINFQDISEAGFAGEGNEFLQSDPGLWVLDAAQLDIEGAPRQRLLQNSALASPTGWVTGDELRTAPNTNNDVTTFNTIAHDAAVPSITAQWGTQYTEVINLTSNVTIQGTATGRSHVFIKSSMPQHLWYVKLRYMGPRKSDTVVKGRYALHNHHCIDGSRVVTDGGTSGEAQFLYPTPETAQYRGLVSQDSANWSFVAHESHGIYFYDCITYQVTDDSFAWDFAPPDTGVAEDPTHDFTADSCGAFKITPRGPQTNRLAGFTLARGEKLSNRIFNCVTAGLGPTLAAGGPADGNGFRWVSPPDVGVWDFHDNLSHNICAHPWHVWQNDTFDTHVIVNHKAYFCGSAGLMGAYDNCYIVQDMQAYQCGSVQQQATSDGVPNLMMWNNLNWDNTGGSARPYAIILKDSTVPPGIQGIMRFTDPVLKGYSTNAVQINQPRQSDVIYQFVRARLGALGSDMNAGSFKWEPATAVGVKVQWQTAAGQAFQSIKTTSGVQTTSILKFAPDAGA
jgi:hypothetical protein